MSLIDARALPVFWNSASCPKPKGFAACMTARRHSLEVAAKERPDAAKAALERLTNVSLFKALDDGGFMDRLYK